MATRLFAVDMKVRKSPQDSFEYDEVNPRTLVPADSEEQAKAKLKLKFPTNEIEKGIAAGLVTLGAVEQVQGNFRS